MESATSEIQNTRISFEEWIKQARGYHIDQDDIDLIKQKLPSNISISRASKRILMIEIKKILAKLDLTYNPFNVVDVLLGDVLIVPDSIAIDVCDYYIRIAQQNPEEELLKFPYVYIYNKYMHQHNAEYIMQHNITPDKLKSLDAIWDKLLNE